ncbi:voltage-dependent anion-selective channel-like [Macrosteles quadrilineatus]|uniref:voltage-dependent anion-selective channel-like n=1 Tax=Macrosteles quadrilineatus TaxID=74068 RepID=UPI0023E22444|nr:voltage-dependent anion-selective channel-like [Macrosteles quadrilineatus]
MAPPTYGDLGKNARDVFGKGYHFGLWKLDVKTKTSTGVEFSTGGVSNQETGKVFGTLETKYKFKEYGVTFAEKWNTDNVLVTEVTAQDFLKGLKVSLDTSFKPQTGDKSIKAKTEYKNQTVAANADLDFKTGAPLVNASLVFGYEGWLAGVSSKFDSQKAKLVGNSFSLGYAAGNMVFHSSVDNGNDFNGSIYHKVNSNFETGVTLGWSAANNDTRMAVGCKYNLDGDTAVRAKVNKNLHIGLSYQQKLREGVTIALSTLVDGKNFHEGGHKVGFSLELEA